MSGCDVVVAGAGVAGLAAAVGLARRGFAVTVLEARQRAGGRILSVRSPASPLAVELGAEFLHGAAPKSHGLLAEAGALVCDIDGEGLRVTPKRLQHADSLAAVDRVLGRIDPARADESLAAFLARRPGGAGAAGDRAAAARFVEGFHAADLERISAASLAAGGDGEASDAARRVARVVGGYDLLVEELVRRLGTPVRFDTTVRKIAWRKGAVQVSGTGGGGPFEIAARAAVVTVPLGVLKARESNARGLRFDPDPPAARRAMELLEMGSALRLILDFASPPWLTRAARARGAGEKLAFLHLPGPPFQAAWTSYPLSIARLTMWSGGPPARELAKRGAAEIRAIALRSLAQAFGTTAAKLAATVTGAWSYDWDADPLARGAYSYAGVGGASAAQALARPVEGMLFFAGEATVSGDNGTVEGALTSGERAARQVNAALSAKRR